MLLAPLASEFPKLIKTDEIQNDKTIFKIDLPLFAARIVVDYLYWKPMENLDIESAVILFEWLEKNSENFLQHLKEEILKILSPKDCFNAWKAFYKFDFTKVCIFC